MDGSAAARPSPHVPTGLVPGPFHDRLEALSRARSWMGWAGQLSPREMEATEFEYFAIRNQASLFDISPMRKYRLTGPDAVVVANRLVTRDVAQIGAGRVGYVLWCDEEGMLIDDGTLFRFAPDDFRLCCQEPMFSWLLDVAWGFDVEVADETDAIAALSLQGPTAFSVLSGAGIEVAEMRPFDWRRVEPDLWVSRTGFTGDLGYELWTLREGALALWDRLWVAGAAWGLRAIGMEALDIARIEAGFLAAGTDFQPVHAAQRLHRGRTPIELGLGRMIAWDKGHFNGRRALLARREAGPRTVLAKVEIGGFEPARGALIYHRKRREVGHVTSAAWSPTTKRNLGLAELRAPHGLTRGGDLRAEVYCNKEGVWSRRMEPVTILDRPAFSHERARAVPPRPF